MTFLLLIHFIMFLQIQYVFASVSVPSEPSVTRRGPTEVPGYTRDGRASQSAGTAHTKLQTTSPASPPTPCNMSVFTNGSENAMDQFDKFISDGATFIYLKLDFTDVEFEDPLSAYLEDTAKVIDPLTWVWAKGGKGKLLLALPFDFNQLSLATLSPGVFSMTLKIEGSTGCFTEKSDGEKLQAVARLLQEILERENAGSLNSKDNAGDDGEETVICLEMQLWKNDYSFSFVTKFPGSSYTMMQASSAFDCWSTGSDAVTRVYKQPVLNCILTAGFLLALLSPMGLSFFVQKNPPYKDDTGYTRLGLATDLPLGLKHAIFNWANDSVAFAVRSALLIISLTLLQYVPVFISLYYDAGGFWKRSTAMYTGPLHWGFSVFCHVCINIVFIVAAIVCAWMLFQNTLESLLSEHAKMDNTGHAELKDTNGRYNEYMVIAKMPEELWVPSTPHENLQAFFYYMRWRAMMAADYRVWAFVIYGWLKRGITEKVGAPGNPRTVVRCVIFAVLYPPYIVFALILFAFNTLPLCYCVTRCFQSCLSNDVKRSERMFSFLIGTGSVAMFFKFVATFTYVAELLAFLFVGFVLNVDAYGPAITACVACIGHIVTAITDFYDGYCTLLTDVMEIAKEVDKEMSENKVENRVHGAAGGVGDETQAAGGSTDIQMTIRAVGEKAHVYSLVKNNDLDLELYWSVVDKHRPIRPQVVTTLMKLVAIIVPIVFGLHILNLTGSLSKLNAAVKMFSVVILAKAVPTIHLIFKSEEAAKCHAQARKNEMRKDISTFYENVAPLT